MMMAKLSLPILKSTLNICWKANLHIVLANVVRVCMVRVCMMCVCAVCVLCVYGVCVKILMARNRAPIKCVKFWSAI